MKKSRNFVCDTRYQNGTCETMAWIRAYIKYIHAYFENENSNASTKRMNMFTFAAERGFYSYAIMKCYVNRLESHFDMRYKQNCAHLFSNSCALFEPLR